MPMLYTPHRCGARGATAPARGSSFAVLALLLAMLSGLADGPVQAADSREELEKRANALAEQLVARIQSHGQSDLEVQGIRRRLGATLEELGLPKKALQFYRPAEAELARRLPPTDAGLVSVRCRIANCWLAAGKLEEGLEFLRERVRDLPDPAAEDTRLRRELVDAMDRYAPNFHELKAYEDSRALFERSFEIHRELDGESHLDTITALIGLGACEIELGRGASIRELLEDALVVLLESHPDEVELIRTLRNNLAYFDVQSGDPAAREKEIAEYRAIIEEYERDGAPESNLLYLQARENLAYALGGARQFEEAIRTVEALIATLEEARPKSRWKDRVEKLEKKRRDWRKRLASEETKEPEAPPAAEEKDPPAPPINPD